MWMCANDAANVVKGERGLVRRRWSVELADVRNGFCVRLARRINTRAERNKSPNKQKRKQIVLAPLTAARLAVECSLSLQQISPRSPPPPSPERPKGRVQVNSVHRLPAQLRDRLPGDRAAGKRIRASSTILSVPRLIQMRPPVGEALCWALVRRSGPSRWPSFWRARRPVQPRR